MSKCTFLLGVGLLAAVPLIAAQGHPDFAGNWILVHRDVAGGEPAGVFGEVFVATQSLTALSVDWRFLGPAGRGAPGKLVYRSIHSAFPFDGRESNVSDIYATGSHYQVVDTSAWDGDKLIITTTWRGNLPAHVTRKRTLWLDSDGILVVESSAPGEKGEPWSTVQSRYRRIDLLQARK